MAVSDQINKSDTIELKHMEPVYPSRIKLVQNEKGNIIGVQTFEEITTEEYNRRYGDTYGYR